MKDYRNKTAGDDAQASLYQCTMIRKFPEGLSFLERALLIYYFKIPLRQMHCMLPFLYSFFLKDPPLRSGSYNGNLQYLASHCCEKVKEKKFYCSNLPGKFIHI